MYKKLTRTQRAAILVAAGLGLALVLASVLSFPIRSEAIKARIIALLSDELESEVSIDSLEGRLFPRVAVSGRGVTIRQRGRTDVPPLLKIEQFEIRGSFRDLMMRQPRHVAEVRLKGLDVNIPPGDDHDDRDKTDAEQIAAAKKYGTVIIDRFEAPDTVLTIIPRRAGKQPKIFTIHHLTMDSMGIDQTIPYLATLTNPIPKGEIEASGTFGPWNVTHPARTPVKGKYSFANANLDTIDGLAGILKSTGDFAGPLNRIEVEGTTETPNFQVDAGGLPVPLHTRFTAVVDGSDGDTYLKQVDAKFLNTELIATGAVIGLENVRGRQVDVDVTMRKGRIEDLLKLAMNSDKPILIGPAQLQAKLVIPAEKGRKVIDKLKLRGSFGLTQAKFTDSSVQSKLVGLSRRGQGMNNGEPMGDVLSNLKGRFSVENATASFSQLSFGVPGAEVELTGRYGLRSETLDFRGHLRLQAPLSQVAGGGIKGFFLKAVDPFFRKPGAGTELPIKISGTRKAPKFGLDMFNKQKD
jgi:hypothetical protein